MYSLSLIAQMASVSRQGVDLEMHMNGVERILEYHEPKLPSEVCFIFKKYVCIVQQHCINFEKNNQGTCFFTEW